MRVGRGFIRLHKWTVEFCPFTRYYFVQDQDCINSCVIRNEPSLTTEPTCDEIIFSALSTIVARSLARSLPFPRSDFSRVIKRPRAERKSLFIASQEATVVHSRVSVVAGHDDDGDGDERERQKQSGVRPHLAGGHESGISLRFQEFLPNRRDQIPRVSSAYPCL